jgi:preprotein translocase subunit YajC
VYLLLIFVVVLLVFSMVQNNRRRKNTANMQAAIEPGVRVMTTSGIYGIVQDVESDSIVIEISEGVDVRFAKAAVMKVVPHLDQIDEIDEIDELDAAAEGDDTRDSDDGHAHGTVDLEAPETTAGADLPKRAEPARVDGHQPGAGSVSTG